MNAGQPTNGARLALVVLIVLAAIAAALTLAPSARAGTYVAVQCHPDYDLAAGAAVFSRSSDHYTPAAGCAGAAPGLQIHNASAVTKDGRYGAWSWYPPAGTRFTHISSEAHVVHDSGHKGFVTIIDSGGGVSWRWPAEGSWQPVEWSAGSGAVAFTAWQQCFAGVNGGCAASAPAHTYVRRLWFTLSDAVAPSLELGGSVFDPGPRRGPQTAALSSGDVGGGVWRWRLLVNGTPAASAEEGCDIVPGGAARRFVPCPGTASRSFLLDTESSPFHEGANSLTACVSDVGWPANETCSSRRISVDNVCGGSGSGPAVGLDASFAGGRAAATVPSNRRVTVHGELQGPGGGRLSGAVVCVLGRVAGGDESLEASVAADSGGRFSYSPRRGPSRSLRIVHRHGSSLVERTLDLRVRARPRLKVGPRSHLRNGQIARFRGKLPGPAAAGRVVVLQARVGRRWQAFKTARSGPEGRFFARYRFRDTTERRLYRFRAVVREQAGYPYLKGASPIRRAVVSP
jgi:hypothetical protein